MCKKAFIEEDAQILECERCSQHFCAKCIHLSKDEYKMLTKRTDVFWFCPPCAVKAKATWGREMAVEECSKLLMETVTTKLTEWEDKFESRLKQLESQKVAEQEMDDTKTWSGLFKTGDNTANCDVAKSIAREAVQEQVKEQKNREDRDQNIIIFRVEESNSAEAETRQKEDAKFFESLCTEQLEVGNIEAKKVVRLGKKEEGKTRPMKITLNNNAEKRKIMSRLFRLRDAEDKYKNISIQHDMSQEERETTKKLLAMAKEKNEAETSQNFVYKVRGPPWDQRLVKLKKNQQQD